MSASAAKQRAKPKLYSGSRKTARATAALTPGAGRIRINGIPLEIWTPEVAKLHMMEPALIAGELRNRFDVSISVAGGGFMSQSDAAAMALARAYVDQSKGEGLRNQIVAYNKNLLSGDSRKTEPKKFGGPGARRRRQKSYR